MGATEIIALVGFWSIAGMVGAANLGYNFSEMKYKYIFACGPLAWLSIVCVSIIKRLKPMRDIE